MNDALKAAGALAVLVLVTVRPVLAQQSASYKLNEGVLNAGGRPQQGLIATSPSYRMTLDAIGDPISGTVLTSPAFTMSPSLVSAYPPPGEVLNARFDDATTLAWDPEKSAGVYNIYRGTLGTLPGTYGSCYQLSLTTTVTTEPGVPQPSQAWFYLVTVENGLWEEGTKGYASNGAERGNPAPCP